MNKFVGQIIDHFIVKVRTFDRLEVTNKHCELTNLVNEPVGKCKKIIDHFIEKVRTFDRLEVTNKHSRVDKLGNGPEGKC